MNETENAIQEEEGNMKCETTTLSDEKINALWEKVRTLHREIGRAEKAWSAATGCDNYRNPFHEYEVTRGLEQIRNSLIDRVVEIRRQAQCPNVEIASGPIAALKEAVTKQCGDLGFDAKTVTQWVKTGFADKQRTLAWKQAVAQAKRLLPGLWRWRDLSGKQRLDSILKGRDLTLSAYIYDKSYGHVSYRTQEVAEIFRGFEKFVQVVAGNAKPEEARGTQVPDLLTYLSRNRSEWEKDFMCKKHALLAPFESVRFYKNNKVVLRLRKEQDALRIASHLLKEREKDA